MNTQRAYNALREKNNRLGNKKERRRRYKEIIKDMGSRCISLEDIALGNKEPGFLDMAKEHEMTMDEMVVLQQYANAIIDRSTKAAEFLRDSAGEAPKNVVEVADNSSGLSKMSLEELLELKEALKGLKKED